jgi:hypothetical protein
MTKRTCVFLFAAAGVLVVGLATGLVAWATDVRLFAALGANSPAELAYVPGTSQMVAYADVRQVMNSPFRERFRQFQSNNPPGAGSLEARTGINVERDIDRVLLASMGDGGWLAQPEPGVGAVSAGLGTTLTIARGRFDVVRIEALMREHGAQVTEYRGKRLVSGAQDAALAFAEPGLILFGPRDDVLSALDAQAGAAKGISANAEFVALIDDVDEGTAWSVAKFDSLAGSSAFPNPVLNQLPPINWLAASGRVDSGLHGIVRAEARDEQSAQNLRDVVQGFLALARVQGSRDPAYRGMLDSVALTSNGKSVSLSFELTPAVLDQFTTGNAARRPVAPRRP